MITSNPTKEEELMKEVAKAIVGKATEGKKPKITAKELHAICRELELEPEDVDRFTEYIQTPLGKESFKKTVRLEMWKAGYRPRGSSKTYKQRAIELMTHLGYRWEIHRADYPRRGFEVEVFPPEGYTLDGLSSLVCHSWEDVLERLPHFELQKEEEG